MLFAIINMVIIMKKGFLKRILLYILSIIFLFGAAYSLSYFIIYQQDEKEIEKELEKIQNLTEIIEEDEPKQEHSNNQPTNNINNNEKLINVNINELKTINRDVKGWIIVNGTNINYPFVQTTNNDYYLTHSFDKSPNKMGWVFLDYRNKLNGNDKNLILYAHNSKTGKMFGSLPKILTNGWLKNSKNHIIKTSINNQNSLWQVFSIYHIIKTDDYIKTSFYSPQEFNSFINMIKNRSIHNFNVELDENDTILTLSTCYINNNERLVLHAKLIKSN